MNRLLSFLFALLFPLSSMAVVNYYSFWNNYNDLNAERDAFTAQEGSLEIVLQITDGSVPLDLSSVTSMTLRIDNRYPSFTIPSPVNPSVMSTNGVVKWSTSYSLASGQYRVYSIAMLNDGTTHYVFDRYLTVTNDTSSSSGTYNVTVTNSFFVGDTYVTVTNSVAVEIAELSVSNYITLAITNLFQNEFNITQITTNLITITQQGLQSLNGVSTGALVIAMSDGTVITNDGNTFYIPHTSNDAVALTASTNGVTLGTFNTLNTGPGILGELSTSGVFTLSLEAYQWPGPSGGTNRQVFAYVSATSQWFQVPAGVTSLFSWIWGAGSIGGTAIAGGFTYAKIPVQPLEWLEIQVGQGGGCITCGVYQVIQTDISWPNGGRGVCKSPNAGGSYASSGGAGSAILRTNMPLAVAGGVAGGSGGAATLLAGGGLVGGASGLAGAATAGSQTNGGVAATSGGTIAITNGAGQYMMGGQSGCNTNSGHGIGGGGGGYWGGGGGFGETTTYRTTAAGSGFVNTLQGVEGYTYRTYSGNNPVGWDLPEFALLGSTPGSSSTTTTHGNRAPPGGIVIGWVTP